MFSTLFAKILALVSGVLMSAGGILAGTGGLPNNLQQQVSDILGQVGITVPDGTVSGAAEAADDPTDVTTTIPDVTTTLPDVTTTVPELPTTTVPGGTDNGSVTPPPCPAGVTSHGQYVSMVARNTPPGPNHGKIVSAAAKSDCGKDAEDDDTATTLPGGTTTTEADDDAGEVGGSEVGHGHGNSANSHGQSNESHGGGHGHSGQDD